jgi:hypothetical protein
MTSRQKELSKIIVICGVDIVYWHEFSIKMDFFINRRVFLFQFRSELTQKFGEEIQSICIGEPEI